MPPVSLTKFDANADIYGRHAYIDGTAVVTVSVWPAECYDDLYDDFFPTGDIETCIEWFEAGDWMPTEAAVILTVPASQFVSSRHAAI